MNIDLAERTPYRRIKKHFSYRDVDPKIGKEWFELNKQCNVVNSYLKHIYRPYQRRALMYFMYAQQHFPDRYQYLFDMATGSGKTDLMAGIIIYMYLYCHINKFIYTVISKDVISQVYNNFVKAGANKFLYLNNPVLGKGADYSITLRRVPVFPHNNFDHTIYIIMETSQGLNDDWNQVKENGISKSDLKDQKVVILGDEAHHFNSNTKSDRKRSNTLEGTLDSIQNACKYCMQLGFTATPNQSQNTAVSEKYSNEIIYKYGLGKFMAQKYSKNVYDIQSHSNNPSFLPQGIQNPHNIQIDDIRRMISAVLMSQARKIEANDLGIKGFQPIILFKAKYKTPGRHVTVFQYNRLFNNVIEHITPEFLKQFINRQLIALKDDSDRHEIPYAVYKKYHSFSDNRLSQLSREIKSEFAPVYTINVNDKRNHEEELNNLEISNIRAIFEVNKLDEGWDVLNLFDIVRLNDTALSETNQEAQLIGRGARYYNFDYDKRSELQQSQNMKVNPYKRCFDSSSDPLKRLLESLYYHTTNDSKYIRHLRKAFKNNDLTISSDQSPKSVSAHIDNEFKKTSWYKKGYVYVNLRMKPDIHRNYRPEDIGLPVWGNTRLEPYCRYVWTKMDDRVLSGQIVEQKYVDQISDQDEFTLNYHLSFTNVMKRTIEEKVMEDNAFYHFDNLQKYLPNIKSSKDFIKNWLTNIRCKIYTTSKHISKTVATNYAIIKNLLDAIEVLIKHLYNRPRESLYMYPIPIKNVVGSYQKRIPVKQSNCVQNGEKNSKKIKYPWYIYNNTINDSELEKNFIFKIGSKLAKKYNNGKNQFYMIRNEGQKGTNVMLNTHFVTYMPDYILLFNISGKLYEFYAEPKDPAYLDPNNYNYDNTIAKDKLLSFIEPKDPIMKIVKVDHVFMDQYHIKVPFLSNNHKFVEYPVYNGRKIAYYVPHKIETVTDDGKSVPLLYGLRFFTEKNDVNWLRTSRNFHNLPKDFKSDFKDIIGDNNPEVINLLNLK